MVTWLNYQLKLMKYDELKIINYDYFKHETFLKNISKSSYFFGNIFQEYDFCMSHYFTCTLVDINQIIKKLPMQKEACKCLYNQKHCYVACLTKKAFFFYFWLSKWIGKEFFGNTIRNTKINNTFWLTTVNRYWFSLNIFFR